MRGLLGALPIALVCIAIAAPVAAQTEPPVEGNEPHLPWRLQMEAERPPAEPALVRPWYGWQTLATDAASIGLLVVSGFADEPPLAWVGLGVWLIGPPLVHLANANGGSAAISLGIRAAALLLAFGGMVLVLSNVFDDSSSGDGLDGALGGAMFVMGLAGMVACIAIDASLLAFGKRVRPKRREVAIRPWFEPERVQGLRVALTF